jgi:hypothetical protein
MLTRSEALISLVFIIVVLHGISGCSVSRMYLHDDDNLVVKLLISQISGPKWEISVQYDGEAAMGQGRIIHADDITSMKEVTGGIGKGWAVSHHKLTGTISMNEVNNIVVSFSLIDPADPVEVDLKYINGEYRVVKRGTGFGAANNCTRR